MRLGQNVLVSLALLAAFATISLAKSPAAPRRIDIAVVPGGFEPKRIEVHKGEPVTLVFTRKTEKTCAQTIFVYLADDKRIEKLLPLNQPVEVSATFEKSGELGYMCSMKMLSGVIAVR